METDPDGTQILMQLFILVLLTLVNAFFAGAEMAVVSVNKNRVKVLAEEGNKKALLIQSLFEDSTKFLSTIQVYLVNWCRSGSHCKKRRLSVFLRYSRFIRFQKYYRRLLSYFLYQPMHFYI